MTATSPGSRWPSLLRQLGRDPAQNQRSIPVLDKSGPFPLPRAQERIWFVEQLNGDADEYLVPMALELAGPLDIEALRGALRGIVTRHEVLRTSVIVSDSRPMGVLRAAADFQLEVRDEPMRAGKTAALVRQHTSEPLDLADGLPFRARLIRLAAGWHVLCLTFHHLAFDGWSTAILYAELAEGYAALTSGREPVLTELAASYHDVAMWQQRVSEGDGGLDFWRENLRGLARFELPPDRSRPVRRRTAAHCHVVDVAEPVAAALERIAAQHRASLFMVLLAASQVLLHRHSGRTDVTVGTPVSGRSRTEAGSLIGMFVNMVVMRGDTSGDPTFHELVDRVREQALAAYAWQDTAFDRLVEDLAPERDLSRTPLFQIIVKLDNQPRRPPELHGLSVSEAPLPLAAAKYDVAIDFERVRDGLRCRVIGDASLYESDTVRHWCGRLAVLLASLAHAPALPVSAALMLTPAELASVRALAGPDRRPFPDRCLHQLFEAQAASTPDLPAVVDDKRELSYRELDSQASRIAAALRAAGVEPDQPVAVMLDRSTDLLAALIGIMKAGGAYLPVDPETPAARAAVMLAEAGCSIALVQPERAAEAEAAGALPLVPAVAAAGTALPAIPAAPSPVPVHPDNLCAVYFTSGSTGRPKGVACTHRGWVNRIWWMQRRHQLRPGETVLHKTTLAFDDAAVELFWPLLAGGRVAMLGPQLHRDPRAILDAVIRYQAVHVSFVPSVLELVLDDADAADLARLTALRTVLSSGEALRVSLAQRFAGYFGERVKLDNTWGVTEASIDSTCHAWTASGPHSAGLVSLGRPIDNNDVVAVDDDWQPLPPGIVGELCIGGAGLARGYLNDPARTAAVFVPHPYRRGERLYRTGDRGRVRPDGSLEFLGRADNQVKIRGVRIELGEVEAALALHPLVAASAVIACQATGTDLRLVAYVVLAADTAGTADRDAEVARIRAFLSEHLPSYAMPASIMVLPALPLLPNGKLDRRALPTPVIDSGPAADYRSPATAAELAVARIWAEVLGRDGIGADENFFAIGGHSLLAIRIITRMRYAFELDLPVSLMFERPTIAATAVKVEELLLAEIDALTSAEAQHLHDLGRRS